MAMADNAPRAINPNTPPGFSQAVRVGGALDVSKRVATDDAGEVVGVDDIDAQARQACRNLERALQDCESSLTEV